MPPIKINQEYDELKQEINSFKKELKFSNDSLKEIDIFIRGNPFDRESSLIAKFSKFEKSIEKMEQYIEKHEKSIENLTKLEKSIDNANIKIDEITKQRDAVKWFMYGLLITGTYGTFEFIKQIINFLTEKL